MKIESTDFDRADLNRFMDELADHERLLLAARLEAASKRLAALGPRFLEAGALPPGEEWTAHEVLAHIAVLSKAYGVLTYQIASGKLAELDLVGVIHLRDVVGEREAGRSAEELLAAAAADHKRTVEFLRSTSAAALRHRCEIGEGESITASEVARLPLLAHLEQHLEQLEAALL